MIGIDVGASGVRVAEVVTRRAGGEVLRRHGQEALPHGAVRAGVVHDADAVAHAVRRALRTARVRSRRVALAATSSQAVVRATRIPVLTARERQGALPHIARDILPIPVERAVLDFAPTSAPVDGHVDGLLVGMPADDVAGLVAAVERAGASVGSVDFGAFAALRALPRTPNDAHASVTLDLGASTTTLTVEADGMPVLVRVLSRGGDEITAALSERLGISHAEAEERKRRADIDPDDASDLAEVCRDAMRPLMSEVRSSLDYFRSAHAGIGITRMRLVGGGSLLSGVRELFERSFRIVVDVVDPLAFAGARRRPDPARAIFAPHAAVAVGLTRGVENVDL
ncbi:type IV pilus assembly protein PilM [Microbacterium karelineae]|uniref:type IV pilus assembly protein PilM n=1 Tax=Microbacterium karelineae TaxID=2654283 RepID=UPI0012EADFE6|nr:type IV pilus assembly protein PilM [Microbacterium karelineae]